MFLKKIINKGINKGYEAEECELCHVQFKALLFDRIHKCRRCSKFMCTACGSLKSFIIDEEDKVMPEKHRVCNNCHYDITLINEAINKYTMKWERNSTLARQWLHNLHKVERKDYQYEHFLNYFHKSGDNFNEEIEIIEKDVIRGRTDFSVFNYSMKEFFYTIQISVDDKHTTRLNIANVLYAVAARYDKVGYCQGMSGIAAFLLCFASEETAYCIFCDLIENIMPTRFFERNNFGVPLIGLSAEIYFLKEYYWILVEKKKPLLLREMEVWYEESEVEHTKMIIELASMKALLSIFIGMLNFTNLIFVWEEIKNHRTYEVIEKAFLAIIYLNRINMLEERSFKKLERYFEQLDSTVFQETYHDIEIDKEIKEQLISQFYSQNHKKSGTSKTGNAYTMSKVTKFSETEIKLLEKVFCSGFNQDDFVTRTIMSEEEFITLVELYNYLLKGNIGEEDSILEMTPAIVKTLFRSYLSEGNKGLLFREFIGCFAVCTKNSLKDRICAIVTAFEGSDQICLQNLYKILQNLLAKVPKGVESLKISFMGRMKSLFNKDKFINARDLSILLNDLFINEMDSHIISQCENIIELVIEIYKESIKIKNEARSVEEGQEEKEEQKEEQREQKEEQKEDEKEYKQEQNEQKEEQKEEEDEKQRETQKEEDNEKERPES